MGDRRRVLLHGYEGKTVIPACGDRCELVPSRRRRLTKVVEPPADDTAVGLQGKTVEGTCVNGREIVPCRRRPQTKGIPPPGEDTAVGF